MTLVEYANFTCLYMVNCGGPVVEPNFLPWFNNDTRSGNRHIPYNNLDFQGGGTIMF